MDDLPPEEEIGTVNNDSESETSQYASILWPSREDLRAQKKYVALYNEHVSSVFGYQYLDDRTPRDTLAPSKNTIDTAYYLPAENSTGSAKPKVQISDENAVNQSGTDDIAMADSDTAEAPEHSEFDELPGVLWTAQEKETFFDCLARFSIHRLDEFAPLIPSKTTVEIEAYYHLLKQELKQLTEYRTFRAATSELTYRKEYIPYTMHIYEEGQAYSQIPAAREVDDAWAQFEEQHSAILAIEERKTTDSLRNASSADLRRYVGTSDNTTSNLINPTVANAYGKIRRELMLSTQGVHRSSTKLSLHSLVFYDELIKVRVRDLVLAIITRKGTSGVGSQPVPEDSDTNVDIFNATDKSENTISNVDVWRATEDLRLFETRKAGFRSRYRDSKTPFLSTYLKNVPLSLGPDERKLRIKIPREYSAFRKSKRPYADTDVFIRQIDKSQSQIEYPADLVDETAYASMSEDEDVLSDTANSSLSDVGENGNANTNESVDVVENANENEDESGNDENCTDPAWMLPAPWDVPSSDSSSLDSEPDDDVTGEKSPNEHRNATEDTLTVQNTENTQKGQNSRDTGPRGPESIDADAGAGAGVTGQTTDPMISSESVESHNNVHQAKIPTTASLENQSDINNSHAEKIAGVPVTNLQPPSSPTHTPAPLPISKKVGRKRKKTAEDAGIKDVADAKEEPGRIFNFEELDTHVNFATTRDIEEIKIEDALMQETTTYLEFLDGVNDEAASKKLKARVGLKHKVTKPKNPKKTFRDWPMHRPFDRSYARY